MSDAWIYGEDADLVGELARGLAELGYSPRKVTANGSLLPKGDDGSAPRRPELVVVAASSTCPEPEPLLDRLRDDEDLDAVPLVAALAPEHLASAMSLDATQELLVRPFAPGELEARVRRLRRDVNGVTADEDVVRVGTLEVNVATYQVTIESEPVSFAYMEYELLKFLVTHPGRVFSRESLLTAVWGYDYYGGARTVDVHIRRVRAKLGSQHAARIKTVRSVGYRFAP